MSTKRGFLALAAVALAVCVVSQANAQTLSHISVETRGVGPDVILIPGWGSSREVWAVEADRLDDDHRVHLVQVAGFAGAAAPSDASGPVLAPLVQELDAYIAREGLQQPAIIGHSMGGLAALSLARMRPERVGRVMLVDTHPFYSALFNPSATVADATPQAAAMARGIVDASPVDFARMQRFGMSRLVANAERREEVADWTIASDRAVLAQAMYEVMTTDMRGELAAVQTPLTVLYAYDGAMGPQAQIDAVWQSAYAAAPQARVLRIDDSRHFIMLDQPEAFHASVASFLAAD